MHLIKGHSRFHRVPSLVELEFCDSFCDATAVGGGFSDCKERSCSIVRFFHQQASSCWPATVVTAATRGPGPSCAKRLASQCNVGTRCAFRIAFLGVLMIFINFRMCVISFVLFLTSNIWFKFAHFYLLNRIFTLTISISSFICFFPVFLRYYRVRVFFYRF